MACPTCDHTMQKIGNDWLRHECGNTLVSVFWCPRCGTIKHPSSHFHTTPWLVKRVRDFTCDYELNADVSEVLRIKGILEAITIDT